MPQDPIYKKAKRFRGNFRRSNHPKGEGVGVRGDGGRRGGVREGEGGYCVKQASHSFLCEY